MITNGNDNRPAMKLLVTYSPFAIKVFNLSQDEPFLVWQTADTPFYFTANGDEDYAIIQSVKKPAAAKYIGFGEQGGHSLSKNTAQANYFNFDNMRYRQVYDRGPLDAREPSIIPIPFSLSSMVLPTKTALMPLSSITQASCLLTSVISTPAVICLVRALATLIIICLLATTRRALLTILLRSSADHG